MNYEEASKLPNSEKITLVTCESSAKVKLFTLYSGNIYKRNVDFFVKDLKLNGISLEQAENLSELLTTDNWFYEITTKTLYVNVGGDPKEYNLSVIYKHFFSNAAVILPHDLQTGEDVEWLPIISSIGSIGQQLDDENTGIVLESQSDVEFLNDGFWDSIYDKLIFENKEVIIYSWFSNIPHAQAKRIFLGVIESKDFSPDKVVFRLRDYVYRLRSKVNLGLFSESDGELLESSIGKPKRRIYGQVKQAQCIPIDCTLDGYPLTGTVSTSIGSDTMIGVGTEFLKELNQNDQIIFIVQDEEVIYTVDLIQSNTSLTLTKIAEETLSNYSVKVNPARPYRFKNRRWHIAGHKLRQSQAVITDIINARNFVVDDVSEFAPGDVVRVLGQTTQITRISGSVLVLEQNIFPIPVVGVIISRFPITKLHYGERELIPFRDFSLTNVTESIIEIFPLAEFEIANELVTDHNLSFNNASTTVSSSANADLRTIISPGDWIRPEIQNNDSWYEVHHVGPQVAYLKTPFNQGGGNRNEKARIKKVHIINDDSLITVDCYGKDTNDKWMKTASDCVKDLVVNDAGFAAIDEDSFDQAKIDCSYTISMVFPEIGSEPPLIRDIITLINESVFGSLYGNSSQEISYSIVNSRRPDDISPIMDDDIISWSAQSNQKIVNSVKINYRPSVDKVTGNSSTDVVIFNNEFVDQNVGIQSTLEKTCYLFNESDAITIAQRFGFYNSLSRTVITLKAKAQFFTNNVNDRVYITLDRLFQRYGGSDKRKIGVVSGIKKGPYDSEVILNDMGNIFNRCPTIAPSTTQNFTNASNDEKIKFGYILDPDSLLPGNSEDDLGSQIIG